MSIPTLHAVIHGRVQGVFFRDSTRKEATRLGLTGWVRNLPDGSVEVYAEGDQKSLETLHDWLHEGPPAAQVTEVDAAWGRGEGEAASGFTITG